MDIITYALLKSKLGAKADLINGKIPAEQLPSYVDDIVEVNTYADLPEIGEEGKIYLVLDTSKSYRWSGSQYTIIADPDLVPLKEITWADLKELRDTNQLVPGQQYRIIDYVTTTNGAGCQDESIITSSAGHQFDIIVTADTINTLNENARACIHFGDTYFGKEIQTVISAD